MKRDPLAAKLAALDALRARSDSALRDGIVRALADRTNHVVAKAAAMAAERGNADVTGRLIDAYGELFDGSRSDLVALGKTAIANALVRLEHRDPAPFVRGLEHVQMEPAWGGPIDVAVDLRSTCALALPGCDLPDAALMRLLVDRLGIEQQVKVRVDLVRAIAATGGESSVLLLRLKARCGDADAAVTGECLSGLMQREPHDSLAFVASFLSAQNDAVRAEAAYVLAASSEPGAFDHIDRLWAEPLALEKRQALLLSCAASRCERAAQFLVSAIADVRAAVATSAVEALAQSRFRDAYAERAAQAVAAAADRALTAAFRQAFNR